MKFSLYAWIIHGFHFLLIKNKGSNPIENETFLFEKDKLFLKDVSLKTFIKRMIKIIFTSFDKDFFVKDKIKNKFDILYSAIEQELVNGSSFPIIAERMGVKTSALSHWIKRNIGVNYEDLLAYIQVEKIAEYLRNSDKSLAKIGRCIGLRFEPLVSEKFKKITGHSPTDYRNYFYLRNEK